MRVCLLFFLIVVVPFYGQKQQLYNADYLPQALLLNPGSMVSYDWHAGIPLLSGIGVGVGSKNITVYDLFQVNADDTFNQRLTAKVEELTNRDYVAINQNLEIINFGFRLKNGNYFSAGWYQEIDFISYFPKDIARLAYEGNAQNLNYPFKASDIKLRAEAVSVFHMGINKQVNERFTAGARIKFYSSIFGAESTTNTGTFTTQLTPDGPNYYEHRLTNLSGGLKIAGLGAFEDFSQSQLLENTVASGNYGLGLDLGFTYQLDRQLFINGSLLDLGALFYKINTYEYYGEGSYTFDGIELIFPSILDNDNEVRPYWENLEDDFNENLTFDERAGVSYTVVRPVKLFSGFEYRFGRPSACNCLHPEEESLLYRAGLQGYVINRPQLPQASLTAYFDAALGRNFRGKVTYSADPFSYTNIGFLISVRLSSFNFYFTADNLLDYNNLAKSNTASLQLGLQLISNSK